MQKRNPAWPRIFSPGLLSGSSLVLVWNETRQPCDLGASLRGIQISRGLNPGARQNTLQGDFPQCHFASARFLACPRAHFSLSTVIWVKCKSKLNPRSAASLQRVLKNAARKSQGKPQQVHCRTHRGSQDTVRFWISNPSRNPISTPMLKFVGDAAQAAFGDSQV